VYPQAQSQKRVLAENASFGCFQRCEAVAIEIRRSATRFPHVTFMAFDPFTWDRMKRLRGFGGVAPIRLLPGGWRSRIARNRLFEGNQQCKRSNLRL
jgi:hypothetical protein